MTQSTRVSLQTAFVLHRRPFREASLIVDALTEEYGKVSLLATSARGRQSNRAAVLQPFSPLCISWTGCRDLVTLTAVEALTEPQHLSGTDLYCGLYLNELLNRMLHPCDPCPEIFLSYRVSLQALLNRQPVEPTLRYFELDVLEASGYGLQLLDDALDDQPIQPRDRYRYCLETGPVRVASSRLSGNGDEPVVHGSTLIALNQRQLNDPEALTEAKQLMRCAIRHHLQGKPLHARRLFQANVRRHTVQTPVLTIS